MTTNEEYEIALSFAGEDRSFVERIAIGLRRSKVKVFYDQFEKSKLWGKDLYQYLSDLYSSKSRYCIIFISKAYVSKPWPRHELKAAQAKQLFADSEYILPIRLDDSELPGLHPTIYFIDARHLDTEEIIQLVMEKLGRTLPKLFHGIDLGHDIDPLRSALEKLEPTLFDEICSEILTYFKFRVANEQTLESSTLSQNSMIGKGVIYSGLFYDSLPYSQQFFRKIGYGLDENASHVFGEEVFVGGGTSVQGISGLAKVVIHSRVQSLPTKDDIVSFGEAIKRENINTIAFLVNENFENSTSYFQSINQNLKHLNLNLAILFCDDLTYPVLTTDIYRKHESELKWLYKNHL